MMGEVVSMESLRAYCFRMGRSARPRLSTRLADGPGSCGSQDPGQVGDGSGEIELGGSLVTPDATGSPADSIAPARPGGGP